MSGRKVIASCESRRCYGNAGYLRTSRMEIDVSYSKDAVSSEKGSAIIYVMRYKLLAHIHERIIGTWDFMEVPGMQAGVVYSSHAEQDHQYFYSNATKLVNHREILIITPATAAATAALKDPSLLAVSLRKWLRLVREVALMPRVRRQVWASM